MKLVPSRFLVINKLVAFWSQVNPVLLRFWLMWLSKYPVMFSNVLNRGNQNNDSLHKITGKFEGGSFGSVVPIFPNTIVCVFCPDQGIFTSGNLWLVKNVDSVTEEENWRKYVQAPGTLLFPSRVFSKNFENSSQRPGLYKFCRGSSPSTQKMNTRSSYLDLHVGCGTPLSPVGLVPRTPL